MVLREGLLLSRSAVLAPEPSGRRAISTRNFGRVKIKRPRLGPHVSTERHGGRPYPASIRQQADGKRRTT